MNCKANWRNVLTIAFAVVGLAAAGALSSRSADLRVFGVRRAMLCVTEGTVGEMPGERLSVRVPKMRAYVNQPTSQTIEAHFTYLGPTGSQARLGSGEMRRQFGLKLHAQDACNLVYAMWRIEPESKLVVSVKANPGEHTSAECGNRGYRNIKPVHSSAVPALGRGDRHSLRAEMNGERLRVLVDNVLIWEGTVGTEAARFDGPVGIRSDNAALEMELLAGEISGTRPDHPSACRSGPSESE
jgi:hypothetical protein